MTISKNFLEKKILFHKKRVLYLCNKFGGHISSSFSTAEIIIYLYYNKIISRIKNSNKFVISKGHGEVIYFSVLCDLKYFNKKKLFEHYRSGDCYLGGHVSHKINGVEFSTGSLGHGLSYSVGLAHADKINNNDRKIFCLHGDAELNEGSVWEAAVYAANKKLNNLIVLVDCNKIGSSDFTKNYISNECLALNWKGLGWNIAHCDGHNFQSINKTIKKNMKSKKPTVIILDTLKGNGVSFIENDPIWHVKGLDDKSYLKAIKEIK